MKEQTQSKVWKSPEHTSICPLEVWGAPPSRHFRPANQKLSKPHSFGVSWSCHYLDMIDYIFGQLVVELNFLSLLPRG